MNKFASFGNSLIDIDNSKFTNYRQNFAIVRKSYRCEKWYMLEKKHIIILKIWGTKRTWKCKLQLVYCDRPRDVVGYRFDKGPVYVRNTWFHGFQPTSIYNSSALSNTECFSLMNPQNMVENVLFGFDDVNSS